MDCMDKAVCRVQYITAIHELNEQIFNHFIATFTLDLILPPVENAFLIIINQVIAVFFPHNKENC